MHGPCGEILGFCLVGFCEGLSGACFDFASLRHSCTESCGLCCSNTSCCSCGCSFENDLENTDDLRDSGAHERRPLLEDSNQITAQPEARPVMKA
ncbi:hypothetical protein GGU10DRAFT_355281 [Lentinula aff. detonsa]|uniref:Secreted protein n=1 Tax=Lentinula aff. detonsa TaxID=2804958 RepID=A0AA38KZD0_9AGAR|nr:hypothetical protein GGU10DRAFT_355281 [Lentinula aff. detonsa]